MADYNDLDDIGGGRVHLPFTMGGRRMKTGDRMTAAEILAIPRANRMGLIQNRFIKTWPAGMDGEDIDRHVVNRGSGKFDVIEGRRLNAQPLTQAQAHSLAGGNDAIGNA